ncbi:MAG: hypothetical protein DI598_06380 [Pseudopedobacter saltans]|uniref:GxGYxYP putative glycoside hydrolase C-terminal domain-containing protein n=1 Tax=Pseudopedobacter saltans TaxID=151895 RepID=A0A2W5F733_9SPHI|nr:MAG: hypothetical protein DI598_06380 [Pseudopedobacter saltans]
MLRMKKSYCSYIICFLISFFYYPRANAAPDQFSTLSGQWVLLKDSSDYLPYFSDCRLDIKPSQNVLDITWYWASEDPLTFHYRVPLDGKESSFDIEKRVWPYENFMGVNYIPKTKGFVRYQEDKDSHDFRVNQRYTIKFSQGSAEMEHVDTYHLSEDRRFLYVYHSRKGREHVIRYVFRHVGTHQVFTHVMKNEWHLKSGMGENAFFISLQGVVNRSKAQLYLEYPKDWEYKESYTLRSFYEHRLDYEFQQIVSVDQAISVFGAQLKGYIVWDENSRSSLCVAFTLAGLKDAIVVPKTMEPLMKAHHLAKIADFSDRFIGMNDEAIFRWAYNAYGKECNKDYIVWMGGATGDQIMPAIADFGVSKKAFFVDLSTDPKHIGEYRLADSLLSLMHPFSMVMGWHSYGKDLERNYVTLTSKHGMRVEGLNTFPNLSFTSMTPPSKDFKFKNNHHLQEEQTYKPEKKVYITLVQTDGLGLGSWNNPERGTIPYAWEVTINWYWMAPVLLQFYYENATPNDFFIGSLSGPGYLYPKAIPDSLFEPLMHIADTICKKLDLNVFETMDYSEGSSGVGNDDLPLSVIKKYFNAMPNIIGMVNGYAPSYTFGKVGKKPLLSFDYYLDERMPENDVAEDLNELIRINFQKPYFMTVHVREWNDIDRVKRILANLNGNVEVVPLDVFLKMAGEYPSFKDHYLLEKKKY